MVERLVLERRNIGPQQPRHPFVPHRNLAGSLEQAVERFHGHVGLEQPVLAGGAMKQERCGIDRGGRIEIGQQGKPLVETIATDALSSQPQPHGITLERLGGWIG